MRLKKIVEQAEKLNSAPKPDLLALRDRVLKSLLSGRGKVATTSPQYKTAARALDRFIEKLQKSIPISTLTSTQEQINTPESQATWESRSETFLEEVNWQTKKNYPKTQLE